MSDAAVVMDPGLRASLGPGMTTLKFHLRRFADGLAFFAEIEELLRRKAE
jgi:hypothetical protein